MGSERSASKAARSSGSKRRLRGVTWFTTLGGKGARGGMKGGSSRRRRSASAACDLVILPDETAAQGEKVGDVCTPAAKAILHRRNAGILRLIYYHVIAFTGSPL